MKNFLRIILVLLIAGIIFIFVQNSNTKPVEEDKIIVVEKTPPISNPVDEAKGEAKEDKNIKNEISKIPEVVEWQGIDPYPGVDWSGALPELKTAVNDFEKEWGKPLHIRQIYRPALYGKHIRSVWEVWRYINGKSYTNGYKCDEITHINTKNIGTLNQNQKDYINKEVKKHSFAGGDTPPGCVSDHAKGIAIDITPPYEPIEYDKFINTAYKVGLCHYIKGDEPHFGLTAQLPVGTDCFVK